MVGTNTTHGNKLASIMGSLRCTLFIIVFPALVSAQQSVPYGNNSSAGKYVTSGDAYEVYGDGPPLLFLHGGYISEFEKYFPDLIKNFKVIAVATRGHGGLRLVARKCRLNSLLKTRSLFLNRKN